MSGMVNIKSRINGGEWQSESHHVYEQGTLIELTVQSHVRTPLGVLLIETVLEFDPPLTPEPPAESDPGDEWQRGGDW